MNPEKPSRDEIEARITALLLGELPAEEAKLLRWTISQDAGLQKLHDELQSTIVLVHEAKKNTAAAPAEANAPLKLSDERRQKLLAHFKTPRPKESFWIRRLEIPSLIPVLVVVAAIALLAALMLPALSKAKNRALRASAAAEARQEMQLADKQPAVMPAAAEPTTVTVASEPVVAPPPAAIVLPESTSSPEVAQTDTLKSEAKLESVEAYFNDRLPIDTQTRREQVEKKWAQPPTEAPAASTIAPSSLADSIDRRAESQQSFGSVYLGSTITNAVVSTPADTFALPNSSVSQPVTLGGSTIAGEVNSYAANTGQNFAGGGGGGGFGGFGGRGGLAYSSQNSALQSRAQNNAAPVGGSFDFEAGKPADNGLAGGAMISVDPNTRNIAVIADGATVGQISGVISQLDQPVPAQKNAPLGWAGSDMPADQVPPGTTFARRIDQFTANPQGAFPGNTSDRLAGNGNKVPLIGDVPLVGNLFKNSNAANPTAAPMAPLTASGTLALNGNNSFDDGKGQNNRVVGVVNAFGGAGGLRSAGGGGGGGGALNYITQTTLSSSVSAEARNYISSLGVDMNSPGHAVFYNDKTGKLYVRASKDELDKIQQGLKNLPASQGNVPGNSFISRNSFVAGSNLDLEAIHDANKMAGEQNLAAIDSTIGLPVGAAASLPPVTQKLAEDDTALLAKALPAPIPQPEILTSENNFSTFSLNVSDVSFQLAAASLQKGLMPDAASIRSEEFINAFDYRDPEAAPGRPMAFTAERARYPFAQNRDLLRFSIKTAAAGRSAGRALNIVLLLDISGSMERADRVAIIHEALRVLAGQLQPQDTVSVVTFARTARLWADGIPGDKAGETLDKVGGITPEGGTNLEEAMRLAYETARRHYLANGMNRVVLLTDGAANLGNVDPDVLRQKVEAQRKQGIALDCFGIGFDGYDDEVMEQLSRNGDGRYAFINSPAEAGTEFAAKLAGALQVAASDVKVQVEFNPDRVISYRQIGYAKHQLTKEQFRDNSVLAAEIAAQEAGNALYTIETKPDGTGPIATVRVRYKVPGTTDYQEHSWEVAYEGKAPALEQASPAMRLAATASAFSEWLAGSPFAQEVTPDELLNYLSGVPEVYGADGRPKKLEWMIRQAKSLSGK